MNEQEKIISEIIETQGKIITRLIEGIGDIGKTAIECSNENVEALRKLKEATDLI